MATGATVYNFDIDLADADRNVYESLALRVARHPSESEEYLLTRVLAYALEFEEGIAFSTGGLSDPDDPALTVRDLTGALRSWIEIGSPDAARLHKASKASPRVAVYTRKDSERWAQRLAGERIHRAEALEAYVTAEAIRGRFGSPSHVTPNRARAASGWISGWVATCRADPEGLRRREARGLREAAPRGSRRPSFRRRFLRRLVSSAVVCVAPEGLSLQHLAFPVGRSSVRRAAGHFG
jgi:uncharacterized protein YaeQ